MTDDRDPLADIDWSLTTWEGNRREQLRRWRELPLDRVIASLEDMQRVIDALADSAARAKRDGAGAAG